jgi:hypothetical protein
MATDGGVGSKTHRNIYSIPFFHRLTLPPPIVKSF